MSQSQPENLSQLSPFELKDYLKKQNEAEERKLDRQSRMGKFAVFANQRRAELGIEEDAENGILRSFVICILYRIIL